MLRTIAAQQIVEDARSWLGVPFQHQGRTRYGVDCVGLPVCIRHARIPWPEALAEVVYPRNPTGRLEELIGQLLTRITAPEVGCIAAIAWPKQNQVSHVGILTPDTIIHAYAQAGRVVETGYRGPWVRWTRSLWRLPAVVA